MGQKICPLSFFNFYINKEAAQAGGCHLCVEEACALWDENYQQCSGKSAFDAVGAIADFFTNTSEKENNPVNSSPIGDILNKLRKKKLDLPTKITPFAKPALPTPSVATPPDPPPPPPPPITPKLITPLSGSNN